MLVSRRVCRDFQIVWFGMILLAIGAFLCAPPIAHAQRRGGYGYRSAVGGVLIDAQGALSEAPPIQRRQSRDEMLKQLQPVPAGMHQQAELRMISLAGLEAECRKSIEGQGKQLPDAVRYLAGLQRVQYVLLYPEYHDIVLAGPGEGWMVNDDGSVVGKTTHLPVLHLDDLLVALRSAQAARQVGISCSIDPTAQGRQALTNFLKHVHTFSLAAVDGMARALGPQKITLQGIPTNSHFARVLVAGDYRMKRIAMKLEPSPVPGLHSFLDMLKARGGRTSNLMPRWWMACNYEALAHSDDRLAWELRGPGVKVMTEDEFITADQQVRGTGRRNPIAQKFAETMTEKFTALSRQEPIFGQLRNIMDLCVVAALIEREGMLGRVGCELPLLTGQDDRLELSEWPVPRTVSTQCSFLRAGSRYIITASGGVQIESWQVAANVEQVPQVGQVRTRGQGPPEHSWWWNAAATSP